MVGGGQKDHRMAVIGMEHPGNILGVLRKKNLGADNWPTLCSFPTLRKVRETARVSRVSLIVIACHSLGPKNWAKLNSARLVLHPPPSFHSRYAAPKKPPMRAALHRAGAAH